MTAAQKLISVADGEVGYLEKKSNAQLDSKTANAGSANYTKYARDLFSTLQGQAWCDMFVDWCFVQAFGKETARALLCGGFSAYTPTSAAFYKGKGQYHKNSPQPGDQIFFRNNQRIYHTGIVTAVKDGRVYTIEGNTSAGAAVIENGGAVCRKSYSLWHPLIDGYGRPDWALVNAQEEKPMDYKQLGWNHDSNGWWYAYGHAKGEYHVNNAVRIDGSLYFFDTNGYCVKNPTVTTDAKGALIRISGMRV